MNLGIQNNHLCLAQVNVSVTPPGEQAHFLQPQSSQTQTVQELTKQIHNLHLQLTVREGVQDLVVCQNNKLQQSIVENGNAVEERIQKLEEALKKTAEEKAVMESTIEALKKQLVDQATLALDVNLAAQKTIGYLQKQNEIYKKTFEITVSVAASEYIQMSTTAKREPPDAGTMSPRYMQQLNIISDIADKLTFSVSETQKQLYGLS